MHPHPSPLPAGEGWGEGHDACTRGEYHLMSVSQTGSYTQRVHGLRARVQLLYRQAGALQQPDRLLGSAFEELTLALEELHSAEREHARQQNTWLDEQVALRAEIQRYQELFLHAPIGYIITSTDGTVRQVNVAGAALLGGNEKSLVGRSLSMFVPEGQRRPFRADIAALTQAQQTAEWQLRLQRLDGESFDAEMLVTPACSGAGRVVALRWLVRPRHAVEHAAVLTPNALVASVALPNSEWLAQECRFFADAAVALALVDDFEQTCTQIAQRAVGAFADACLVVLPSADGGERRLMLSAQRPPMQGDWQRVAQQSTIDIALSQTRNYHGSEAAALAFQLGATATPNDSALQREPLAFASAIATPLRLTDHRAGMFALLSTAPNRWVDATTVALFDELGRRLTLALLCAEIDR